MKEKFLGIRLPEKLDELLDTESRERNTTKSAVIRSIIGDYFDTKGSDEKFYLSLAEETCRDLKDLTTRERALANMMLSFVHLFLYATPGFGDGYEKTKEFRQAAAMTNKWFERMLRDIHEWNPDFFGQIEDILMVRGELK